MKTIADIIKHMQNNHQNPFALNKLVDGKWIGISTSEMLQQIKEIALGLQALGIKKGQRISILAFPSPEWSIIDMAIVIAGGISVPIFPNISDDNLVFEIEQTDASTVFLGSDIPDRLYPAHEDLFKEVISINGGSHGMTLEKLREMGRLLDKSDPQRYEELLVAAHPDDVATIIYTSGTTGLPKGAELTQSALTSLIPFQGFEWKPEKDRYLSLLPLAHIFGRVMNICLYTWGISVYYLNDPNVFAEVCREVHPTILVVVPRVLEKAYAKMLEKVDNEGFIKRAIAHWAFDLANDENDDRLMKQLLHPIADKVVYSALREALGGGIRIIISGGAPLNPHLAHFFIDAGFPVYEGWGLTEATPICVNDLKHRKVGTVGPALPGMQIKIAPDGEVLAKGPIVMRGYYKNPEMTKATLTEDGWLRTGDKGTIDAEGYLTLTGRIKELLKTSTGEYVVPVPIELALAKVPLVDLAMVVADRRKYATCLIFPNMNILRQLKNKAGYAEISDDDFVNTAFLRDEMQKVIDKINLHLGRSEKILDFRFIPHPPSIEHGELTPSMKLRRDAVEKKYSDLINTMYPKEAI